MKGRPLKENKIITIDTSESSRKATILSKIKT